MVKTTLINGDALAEMAKLPDAYFNAIIVDPPYGKTACKWDNIIPLIPMWKQVERLIKPNGAIAIFCAQPFTSHLIMSNPNLFKYCWVWVKNIPSSHVHAKNKPMNKHEDIAIFSLGATMHANLSKRRMNYYPQGTIKCNRRYKNSTPSNVGFKNYINRKKYGVQTATNYPNTILSFDCVLRKGRLNPTQKPISLIEYLIKTYTLENEYVLDFAMGSGTTGMACKNTNRNFVGIEIEKEMYDTASERIYCD